MSGIAAAPLGPEAVIVIGEALHQLPLDVVGEATAARGKEASNLPVGVALLRALDGGKNAPNTVQQRTHGRAPRAIRASAVPMKAPQ